MTEKSTAGRAVGRFAPSPSGYLHLGNLLSALLAWLDIRSLGGEMVFRLEDLDPARSDPAFAEAMAEDLRWLGLDWDRGWPQDPGYAQSERTALYEEAFQTLKEQGLAYPCWCSRSKRLAAASAPHPGEQEADLGCRCSRMSQAEREALLKAGRNPAWKLNSPDQDIRINDGHYGLFIQNPAREAGDCIIRGRQRGRHAHGHYPGGTGKRPARLRAAAEVADREAGRKSTGLLPQPAADGGQRQALQAPGQPEHPYPAAGKTGGGRGRGAGLPLRPAGPAGGRQRA